MRERREQEGLWLVANLKEHREGIREGAKCYCRPPQWGDGYTSVCVLMKAHGGRWCEYVFRASLLTNWRSQTTWVPAESEWGGQCLDPTRVARIMNQREAEVSTPDETDDITK